MQVDSDFSDFIVIELTDDPTAIAEYRIKARSAGDRLICQRCGDVDQTIAAILVVPIGGDSRLALCTACLVELPAGAAVS